MERRDRTRERASDSGATRQLSLLVGSLDGTVALLRARTGAMIWRRASRRELGMLAHDGTRCYIAFGSRLRLIHVAPQRETREQELRRHDRIRAEPSVLDARTGAPLWRRDAWADLVFSPDGSLVLERAWLPDNGVVIRILDPATGLVRAEHMQPGTLRAVSNQGIAFLTPGMFDEPGMFAVRLEDGAELWRADDIVPFQLAVTGTTIYCGGLITPQGDSIGEVVALDARTGRRLWRWRTPADLPSLLTLWGMRVPRMLAYAGYHAGANVVSTLRQPSHRGILNDLLREIHDGQWRRPYALHNAVNAMWLSAGSDALYLGTRLGLFALRPSDGRLLWHALPATYLSFVSPALIPE